MTLSPSRASLFARLLRAPRRFSFDAAVRILTRAANTDDPAEAVRFRTPPGLAFPPADVLDIRRGDKQPEVTVSVMGLTGPSGVLPRYYTETVTQTLRSRSTSLHEFLDRLSHRFIAFFASAGAKYRPARAMDLAVHRDSSAPDPVSHTLLALTGYATGHLAPRLAMGTSPLLHYAGLFAMRPRSAERLRAMVSDYLGMQVSIIEYAGAWLTMPKDQQTRVGAGGVFCRLGVDAAAGVRSWSPEARCILRIGPLTRDGFERLLPGELALHRLVSLVRAYLGLETGFAINLVLRADQVVPVQLNATADPPPRLGWNTWLPIAPASPMQRHDADDALFEADVIESVGPMRGRAA